MLRPGVDVDGARESDRTRTCPPSRPAGPLAVAPGSSSSCEIRVERKSISPIYEAPISPTRECPDPGAAFFAEADLTCADVEEHCRYELEFVRRGAIRRRPCQPTISRNELEATRNAASQRNDLALREDRVFDTRVGRLVRRPPAARADRGNPSGGVRIDVRSAKAGPTTPAGHE